MAGDGALSHLVIRAFKDAKCKVPREGEFFEFEAYVNPSEIVLGYEVELNTESGAGTTGSRSDFGKVKPADVTLNFFIDGTGASGSLVDVQREITQFQQVTGYDGALHRPAYLKVAWGTLQVMRCALKSASIAYRLFRADGVPLRAVISAVFVASTDDETRVAIAQDESADLTHVRLVKAGDTLPALCEQVYGEPRMYPEVARANGLDNFRDLRPGTQLRFPPLER
jgi:nucleoid-associated protein YgaU